MSGCNYLLAAMHHPAHITTCIPICLLPCPPSPSPASPPAPLPVTWTMGCSLPPSQSPGLWAVPCPPPPPAFPSSPPSLATHLSPYFMQELLPLPPASSPLTCLPAPSSLNPLNHALHFSLPPPPSPDLGPPKHIFGSPPPPPPLTASTPLT